MQPNWLTRQPPAPAVRGHRQVKGGSGPTHSSGPTRPWSGGRSTGPNTGKVGGVVFAGFENLTGPARRATLSRSRNPGASPARWTAGRHFDAIRVFRQAGQRDTRSSTRPPVRLPGTLTLNGKRSITPAWTTSLSGRERRQSAQGDQLRATDHRRGYRRRRRADAGPVRGLEATTGPQRRASSPSPSPSPHISDDRRQEGPTRSR